VVLIEERVAMGASFTCLVFWTTDSMVPPLQYDQKRER